MRNKIFQGACVRLLAGVSTLAATSVWADEVVTGNRTIYTGSDLNDITWLDGGHVRYGTYGVEDTLQARIGVHSGDTGTISVTATSTLHLRLAPKEEGSTFNFGSSVDTGTIILDLPAPNGAIFSGTYNVNGGTLISSSTYSLAYRNIGIASGATLKLNASDYLQVLGLSGQGTFVASGGDLYVSGGTFTGTIRNVGALTFNRTMGQGGVWFGDDAVFGGTLDNVGSLTVGYGVRLDASGLGTAVEIGRLGSVTVSGTLDLGAQDATLNHLIGGPSARIGTGGVLTVVGSNYAGILQSGGGIVFNGVNSLDGVTDGAVEIAAGASLTTTNTAAFKANRTVTVNGSYNMQTGTTIDTLMGSGSIGLSSGQNLTINGTGNSSFSGTISGQGGIVSAGAGTLTLTGSNTYSGDTTLYQGTLIGNALSLQGNIYNGANLVFDQASDGTFRGVLSGFGQLTKQGAGKLSLTGTSAYYGQTTISGGSLSVNSDSLGGNIVNNASLIFDQNFNGTFAAAISGSGSVRKLGTGKLILSGNNTYTGPTYVTEGTLSVNGMLASDVLVESGARLGGSGSVNSFVAQAGSFVTPGNSIGTLSVAGNATLSSGSTYVVEANAAGASDRVNATGQAIIGPTAAVYATSESGLDTGAGFPQSQTYRIVTAAGGISGTFGSVTDNFAYLVPTLSYDANNVYLTLTREAFVTGSNPPNANGVAGAIDQLGPGTIYDAVLFMNNDSKATGLRSLAGELHPSVQRALMDSAAYTQSALTERLANGSDQPYWISTVSGRTNYRPTAATFGLVQDTNLVMAGADIFEASDWRAGILGGYGSTRINLSDINATAKVDTFEAGAYGSHAAGGFGFRYGAISAVHQISTSRAITLSTLSENEQAGYLGFTQQVFGEASYRFSHDSGYIEPFLGATAVYQDSQPFRESGGASALDGQVASSFNQTVDAGVRFKQGLSLGDVEARLVGKLGWRHTFGRNAFAANASIGGSSPFSVSGLDRSRDVGIVEAGIGFDLGKGLDVNFQYQGAFGRASSSSAFNARLSASF
ncbi:MAG TPA: autotransporter domain-containing protein [Ensifer sp.]|nr:autotransporter domain-containing protein [Ensifer sp.]